MKVWFPRPHENSPIGVGIVLDSTFIDPNNGWAVIYHEDAANKFELLRTKDGGKLWSTIHDKLPSEPLHLSFLDENNGWLLGDFRENGIPQATIIRTTDGGVTWTKQGLQAPVDTKKITNEINMVSQKMWFFNETEGVLHLALDHGDAKSLYMYFTSDRGDTWSQPIRVDLVTQKGNFGEWQWDNSESSKYVFTKGNKKWISFDYGATWSVEESPVSSTSAHPPSTPNMPATTPSNAKTEAPVETKSCEQIHDPKKPDTLQGNQLDLAKVKAGDKIVGLTIAEVTNKIQGITDDKAKSIRFCGTIKVSGTFVYYKNHEYFSNAISFEPDQESLRKLPAINGDAIDRRVLIVFWKIPGAVKEKLGDPEIRGTATFEITNYNIKRAASEIWDTADILEVS